jgi:hypothetical protein
VPPIAVVTPAICEWFAIGPCIGTDSVADQVPRRGRSNAGLGLKSTGSSGSSGGGSQVGTVGGGCP